MGTVRFPLVLALFAFTALAARAEEPGWTQTARELKKRLGSREGPDAAAIADDLLKRAREASIGATDELFIHRLVAGAYLSSGRYGDALRHGEAALWLQKPSFDPSVAEIDLRLLCARAAFGAGQPIVGESHAMRVILGVADESLVAKARAIELLLANALRAGRIAEALGWVDVVRAHTRPDRLDTVAPRTFVQIAEVLVDVGLFRRSQDTLTVAEKLLGESGSDATRGWALLVRTRALRRSGDAEGAKKPMKAARRLIQVLDDREAFARLAIEEALDRIERQNPKGAVKWIGKYLERRPADLVPDPSWDHRLQILLGVAYELDGDQDAAVEAWEESIVKRVGEGPVTLVEAKGYLSCAAFLLEDKRAREAEAIALRADLFISQYHVYPFAKEGLQFAAEVRRRIARSTGDAVAAEDFAQRLVSPDEASKALSEKARSARRAGKNEEAERLMRRAIRCAPWSAAAFTDLLHALVRRRALEDMRIASDEARLAGHVSSALFAGGLIELGARDGGRAVAKLGTLLQLGQQRMKACRYPLSLGLMLIGEPGVAARVLGADPGWEGGAWQIADSRRVSALRWRATAHLQLGDSAEALRLLRERPEASHLQLAPLQEIEWLVAYAQGRIAEARKHVDLLLNQPGDEPDKAARQFRATLKMERGKWASAHADWEAVGDSLEDSGSILAGWLCARFAGDEQAVARWSARLDKAKVDRQGYADGKEALAAQHRKLVGSSLAGESDLGWEFFLLGLAQLQAGDKIGARASLAQAAARSRESVATRTAALRLAKHLGAR
jgi:tetratricopeptide (TPR) repeat protein